MRNYFSALLIFCLLFTGSTTFVKAQNTTVDSTQTIENEIGTVKHIAGKWLIVVSSDNSETRYFPSEIPEGFQTEGLEVVFSGILLPIPPNVRMMGNPIDLTDLRKLMRLDSE